MAFGNTLKEGMGAMEPIRSRRLSALLSVRNEEFPEHTPQIIPEQWNAAKNITVSHSKTGSREARSRLFFTAAAPLE